MTIPSTMSWFTISPITKENVSWSWCKMWRDSTTTIVWRELRGIHTDICSSIICLSIKELSEEYAYTETLSEQFSPIHNSSVTHYFSTHGHFETSVTPRFSNFGDSPFFEAFISNYLYEITSIFLSFITLMDLTATYTSLFVECLKPIHEEIASMRAEMN